MKIKWILWYHELLYKKAAELCFGHKLDGPFIIKLDEPWLKVGDIIMTEDEWTFRVIEDELGHK